MQVHVAYVLQHAFWLTLFVLVPLAVNPLPAPANASTETILLGPKALFLSIALVLGLMAALTSHPSRRMSEIPTLAMRAPLPIQLMIACSTIPLISVVLDDMPASIALIGSQVRFDGALIRSAWFYCAIVAFVLVRGGTAKLSTVLRYMLVGAALVGVWASVQAYGVEPLGLIDPTLRGNGTPAGPLGHRALVAGLMGVALSTLIAWVVSLGRPRPLGLVAIMVLASSLVASEGRAGLVGFGVAWALVGVLTLRRSYKVRTFLVASLVVVASGAAVMFTKDDGSHQFRTLSDAVQGGDSSLVMRVSHYWPVAIRAVLARPVQGWGIDGYADAFWSLASEDTQEAVVRAHMGGAGLAEVVVTGSRFQFVREVGSTQMRAVSFNVDRAHNLYIDTAVSFGVFGAAALIALILSSTSVLYRSWSPETFAVLSGFVAFCTFSLVWFATLQLSPIVWSLVGAGLGAVGPRMEMSARS